MTERRPVHIPAHVLVMLSASTAAYAITLAGVAGAQSANEAALAAARDPLARQVDQVTAGHDQLADRLDRAAADYAAAAQAYLAAGGGLRALQDDLAGLSGVVAGIDGVSRALPATVSLPTVRGSVSAGRAPASHATTGASGTVR